MRRSCLESEQPISTKGLTALKSPTIRSWASLILSGSPGSIASTAIGFTRLANEGRSTRSPMYAYLGKIPRRRSKSTCDLQDDSLGMRKPHLVCAKSTSHGESEKVLSSSTVR